MSSHGIAHSYSVSTFAINNKNTSSKQYNTIKNCFLENLQYKLFSATDSGKLVHVRLP